MQMNQKTIQPKIMTIGTATIDVITIIPKETIEKVHFSNSTSSYMMVEMGRKQEAKSINYFYGGGAVNAAISLKKLGCDLSCFFKVGNDRFASEIIEYINKHDINSSAIKFDRNLQTAVSVLILSHDSDASIFTYRGANTTIALNEVPFDEIKNKDAIYITNLSNDSVKVFNPLIKFAKENGVKVISNPGAKQLGLDNDEKTNFISALAHLDLLVINRKEAEELLPRMIEEGLLTIKKYSSPTKNPIKTGKISVSIKDFLISICNAGVSLAVMTDGKNGSYAFDKNTDKLYHQTINKVEPVSTVGAGDCFTSTLSYFWLMGYPIDQALKLASINSSFVIQKIDAHSGLLDAPALLSKLNLFNS